MNKISQRLRDLDDAYESVHPVQGDAIAGARVNDLLIAAADEIDRLQKAYTRINGTLNRIATTAKEKAWKRKLKAREKKQTHPED